MTLPVAVKACRSAFVLAGLLCAASLAQDGNDHDAGQPADFAALDVAAGEALFERVWVTAPASTTSADGLGPHYNARSCGACHPAGRGGSAAEQLNFVISDPVYGELLQSRAIAGLPAEARVTLVDATVTTVTLADGRTVVLRKPVAQVTALQHGDLQSGVAIRRAPSLRGLALLEQVNLQQLDALADPGDRDGNGISGRVPLVMSADGSLQAGRFGWKATVATLEEQSMRALSLDIGLGTRRFPAAAGDCTAAQQQCLQAAGPLTPEPEVSDQIVLLLLTYLTALPPPQTQHDGAGAQTFGALGCAQCHVPELAGPSGMLRAWSDLLVHDMGPGLADPLPAADVAAAEWRTAPLWGLAEISRYLHDGRAATLEEAILWHGGEAEASVAAFRQLNGAHRERLLAWLHTL